MRDITPLIAPRSIAMIGASSNPTKSGGVLFANLANGGFAVRSIPSIRAAPEIMGIKAYPSLAEVPEQVDLVYIVLPQRHVEEAVKQCVAAGARAACIITAGYSEASPKGPRRRGPTARHRARIRSPAGRPQHHRHGQCRGCGMMGSFVNFPRWQPGGVSLFTQTGIFTGAVMLDVMSARNPAPAGRQEHRRRQQDRRRRTRLPASRRQRSRRRRSSASTSRASAIRARSWPRRERCASSEPIVVLKPGRTREGAQALCFTHRLACRPTTRSSRAACSSAASPRAEDEEDFLNALRALAMLPKPRGRRVGIATTSGALGVISTDLVVESGLELATFVPPTIAAMRTILPDWLDPANPFDFWIGIDMKGPTRSTRDRPHRDLCRSECRPRPVHLAGAGQCRLCRVRRVAAAPAQDLRQARRARDLRRRRRRALASPSWKAPICPCSEPRAKPVRALCRCWCRRRSRLAAASAASALSAVSA